MLWTHNKELTYLHISLLIVATFCKNLIAIGLLNPEIMPGVSVTFGTRQQIRHIFTNVSASTEPNFSNISALVDVCLCMGMIKLT